MKTQMFTSVQEWLNTNPSEELTQKVLAVVNRGVIIELKRELWQKKVQVSKLEKLAITMENIGVPASKELKEKMAAINSDMVRIAKLIPQPKEKK